MVFCSILFLLIISLDYVCIKCLFGGVKFFFILWIGFFLDFISFFIFLILLFFFCVIFKFFLGIFFKFLFGIVCRYLLFILIVVVEIIVGRNDSFL